MDQPEPDPSSLLETEQVQETTIELTADPLPTDAEPVSFDRMSEDELLAGIEGLVPPEKSDDF